MTRLLSSHSGLYKKYCQVAFALTVGFLLFVLPPEFRRSQVALLVNRSYLSTTKKHELSAVESLRNSSEPSFSVSAFFTTHEVTTARALVPDGKTFTTITPSVTGIHNKTGRLIDYLSTRTSLTFKPTKQPSSEAHISDQFDALPKIKLTYTVRQEQACDSKTYAMVIVKTAPTNNLRRAALRKSWVGTIRRAEFSQLLFIVGLSLNPKINKKVLKESAFYGDMIIVDYIDSYYNLTYKGIAAYNWTLNYCSQAKYFIYADDDIVFPIHMFLAAVKRKEMKENSLICHVSRLPRIFRGGTWSVRNREFMGREQYPQFCFGFLYMTPVKVVRDLYSTSQQYEYFRYDDVYFTGLLRKALNYDLHLVHFHAESAKDFIKSASEKLLGVWAVLIHDFNDFDKVWSYFETTGGEYTSR